MRSVVIFSLIFIAINARSINYESVQPLPLDSTPCSQDASSAYLDVFLVIDTSANMGNANLRKISSMMPLILSKFNIVNHTDPNYQYNGTRVGIVTYDEKATIVSRLNAPNLSEISRMLNGLTASTSKVANMYDAFDNILAIKTGCDFQDPKCWSPLYQRPTVFLLFAASIKLVSYKISYEKPSYPGFQPDRIGDLLIENEQLESGTLITINFNPSDSGLTNFLNYVTFVDYVNSTMYNFVGTSASLSKDIEWAMLQANCYCNSNGVPVIYFDEKKNRYTRVAECLLQVEVGDEPSNITDPVSLCADFGQFIIPATILTQEKRAFIIAQINTPESGVDLRSYIGLHKNNQSVWFWYDYNLNEFSSDYSNWLTGYPNGSDSCVIFDQDFDSQAYGWKNTQCNPVTSDISDAALCQVKACDASGLGCCGKCINDFGGEELKKKGEYRRKQILRQKQGLKKRMASLL